MLIMSTKLSQIKLVALGCLSVATLTGAGVINVSSASANDYRYGQSHEDVRGYDDNHVQGSIHDQKGIYRRNDGFYQVRNNHRLCRELRESISSLERTRAQILRRHHYNPERLRWIERELRQKRAEYRRACR
jgi:hypothetical protein